MEFSFSLKIKAAKEDVWEYYADIEKWYYLEKDWFDNPTLISIEEAKKEVELAQKKLELLPRRSVMECILQLLHRLFHK